MGEQSPKYTLRTTDFKAIGRGALMAVAGALLTYLTQWIADTDFGTLQPFVVAGFGILTNVVRKWMSGNQA